MSYFVTNQGQGPCSNAGRGANPQLDSAPFLISLVTPETIERCRRKKYFGRRRSESSLCSARGVQVQALLQTVMFVWRNKKFFCLLPFHTLLKGVVSKRYFVGKIGSNPTSPINFLWWMRLLLTCYPFKFFE